MLVTFTEDNYFYRSLGEKRYELSNHLGNVLSVISDRRLAFDSDANGTTNYYEADVMSSMDYDPYGMLLTGRNWEEVSEPRYGFNGKESDTETYGIGNIYDYGFRIYNPRLGKFLSIDPLYKFYSQLTPYQFASNTPICAVDIDGQESKIVIREVEKNADGTYKIVSVRTIIQNQTATETRVWAGDPIQIDGTTVLAPGQEFQAATTYTYDMIGEEVVGESVLYELVASWMPTPSAAYDYSHGTIPGKQADDLDYLTQTPVDQGLNVLARRDAAAPDNAIVAEDVKAGLFVFTLMIGYNGAQFPSKTLWREKEGVARIDVENPAPGVRSGQIHFQDNNNNKYMWNFNDKKFYGYNASTKQYDVYDKALNEKLMGNDEVVNAIKKSYKFLGEKYE